MYFVAAFDGYMALMYASRMITRFQQRLISMATLLRL